jgi:hypothetical protein
MYISGIGRRGGRRMSRCGGRSRLFRDEHKHDFVSSAEAHTDPMMTQAITASMNPRSIYFGFGVGVGVG